MGHSRQSLKVIGMGPRDQKGLVSPSCPLQTVTSCAFLIYNCRPQLHSRAWNRIFCPVRIRTSGSSPTSQGPHPHLRVLTLYSTLRVLHGRLRKGTPKQQTHLPLTGTHVPAPPLELETHRLTWVFSNPRTMTSALLPPIMITEQLWD